MLQHLVADAAIRRAMVDARQASSSIKLARRELAAGRLGPAAAHLRTADALIDGLIAQAGALGLNR